MPPAGRPKKGAYKKFDTPEQAELARLRWLFDYTTYPIDDERTATYSRLYQILLNVGMTSAQALKLLDDFDSERKRSLRREVSELLERQRRMQATIKLMKSRLFDLRVKTQELRRMEENPFEETS